MDGNKNFFLHVLMKQQSIRKQDLILCHFNVTLNSELLPSMFQMCKRCPDAQPAEQPACWGEILDKLSWLSHIITILTPHYHHTPHYHMFVWSIPGHRRVCPCTVEMFDPVVDEREHTGFAFHCHTWLLLLGSNGNIIFLQRSCIWWYLTPKW